MYLKATFYSCPEAIHASASRAADCFAPLAMTNQRFRMRPIDPTGKSPKVCRVPRAKIFRLTRRANQRYLLAPSHPMRGALRNVTNARWDAVDEAAHLTKCVFPGRRSRVVLAPRCWR